MKNLWSQVQMETGLTLYNCNGKHSPSREELPHYPWVVSHLIIIEHKLGKKNLVECILHL